MTWQTHTGWFKQETLLRRVSERICLLMQRVNNDSKNRKAGFGPALYRLAEAFSLSDYCPHPSNQRRCCKIVLMFQNQSIQESLQGEGPNYSRRFPLYVLPPATSLPLPLAVWNFLADK